MLVTWLKTYDIQTEKVTTRIQVRTTEYPGGAVQCPTWKWKQKTLSTNGLSRRSDPRTPNLSTPNQTYASLQPHQTVHMIPERTIFPRDSNIATPGLVNILWYINKSWWREHWLSYTPSLSLTQSFQEFDISVISSFCYMTVFQTQQSKDYKH